MVCMNLKVEQHLSSLLQGHKLEGNPPQTFVGVVQSLSHVGGFLTV